MKLFTLISLLFCSLSLCAQTNESQAIYNQPSGTVVGERVYQPGSSKPVKEIKTVAVEKSGTNPDKNPVAIDASTGKVITERELKSSHVNSVGVISTTATEKKEQEK